MFINLSTGQDFDGGLEIGSGQLDEFPEFGSGAFLPAPPPTARPTLHKSAPMTEWAFLFEVLLRPAWATSVTKTLMGWNGIADVVQLSSRMPGDSSWAKITGLCISIGGELFADDTACATRGRWTQLVNQLPGDPLEAAANMKSTCEAIGGKPFGNVLQFCAVEGEWSQLTAKLPGDTSGAVELDHICDKLNGISFRSGSFCVVRGTYSQLTTQMPGDANWMHIDMVQTCNQLGGLSFAQYCVLEGQYAQLTTRLPGDTSWQPSIATECKDLGGIPFSGRMLDRLSSPYYCAVKGALTQMTTKVPSLGEERFDFMDDVCVKLGGTSFAHYCALKGNWMQLTPKIPGDKFYQPTITVCERLGGITFSSFCALKGPWTQLTTKLPGDTSFDSEIAGTCNVLAGTTFSHYCAVEAEMLSTDSNRGHHLSGSDIVGICFLIICFCAIVLAAWLAAHRSQFCFYQRGYLGGEPEKLPVLSMKTDSQAAITGAV
eukprot:CAMPEP_0119314616 /NCGR_PEP_ID=MMETSP1333-20130426/33354_1 /TAXON_ID=418940 /ORGANISM="Scyphosphaera apsteinii, Strain RCC1455" /LENGTH=487 /DNA_ID=CAMNT_0007319763 /DNA_START=116 /DNA_END=1579 /DNA_ORIENTATION=+